MLSYVTLIFCCQFAGELFVTLLGLPLPGPVAGMVLLFAGLMLHGAVPADLGAAADALIGNLSLLFVPAGVGVMLHARLIGADWLPLSAGVVVSTALTIAITALTMRWLSPRDAGAERR